MNIASTNDPSPFPHTFNIPLSKLLPHYTHLLLASGCTVATPHPLIPYSSHVIPALSLVHWYTAHPASTGLPPPPLHKTKHVTVIGNGNVALDVARMLLSSPERLGRYDVPAHVLDVLARSQVRHVSIVGRRGPAQAAFTAKELREMMTLENTSFVPLDPSVIQQAEAGPKLERQHKRILDLLKKGSTQKYGETEKSWDLSFFRSPVGIQLAPDGDNSDYPVLLNLAHTTLSPTNSAVPTGIHSEQPTSLVVTALGHHADPNTPWYDSSTGHVRNEAGQVLDADGNIVKRVYTSGWAGVGARGVLATTMMNAYSVGDRIVGETFPEDFNVDATPAVVPDVEVLPTQVDLDTVPEEIEKAVQDGKITTYQDWRAIDAEEVRRGEETGKERERFSSWDDADSYLHKSSA